MGVNTLILSNKEVFISERIDVISDVTPLKTPNPEPEDDNTIAEVDEHFDMRPISNSSSVELVASPENEEVVEEPQSAFVKQRMESLELKPGENYMIWGLANQYQSN